MVYCVHVSLEGVAKKTHCWVSKVGTPAQCEFGTPFVLEPSSAATYLISACDSFDEREVHHLGTIYVRLKKSSGTNKTVTVQSKRWILPTNGDSYYNRRFASDAVKFKFQLQNMEILDLTHTVFVEPDKKMGTEDASDDYSSRNYPESQTYGGFNLATLERQWMLLFPGTIIPGETGIPLNLKVSSVYALSYLKKCIELSKKLRAETMDEKARVFCGVLSLEAKYVNERTDDTKPAQIFGGQEDCDGMSISVAAMVKAAKNLSLWGLGTEESALVQFLKKKEVYLVAGVASPQKGHHEAHMWIMLYEPTVRPLFCETTNVHREQTHFEMAAYAWSETNCYIFCRTIAHGGKPVIGIKQSEMGSLPIKTKAEKSPAAYLLKMKVHDCLKDIDPSHFCHQIEDKPDEQYPNAGGTFSRYIRGSGFRDQGGYK